MFSNLTSAQRGRVSAVLALALAAAAIAIPARAQAQAGQRRGAPGPSAAPMTDVAIAVGGARFGGRVDAHCAVDERAKVGGPRAYLRAMDPWFGQRVAADKPQWRFTLEIRRGAKPDLYDQFVFSFLDGKRGGVIQTIAGAERMGSGKVRVTRHGAGARFEVAGRSKEGQAIQATIDCSRFEQGEAAGG